MRICTLLLIIKDNQVLLAMKKRGFGANLWNGVGGKLNDGESIEDALIRETQEEINVTPTFFQKVAIHDFTFPNGETDMQVHTYLCTQWEGEPTESEEMAPQWFNIAEIPYDTMWQDDRYWMPQVFTGKKLRTTFAFDDNNNLLTQKVETVTEL